MNALLFILTALFCASAIGLLVYMVGDAYCQTRAVIRVIRKNLFTEYWKQPNRMSPGSGYRLWKHFKNL